MGDSLDLDNEVRLLFAAKLREFAAFCRESWTLSEKDMAEFHDDKPPGFRDGYNTAMTDGIDGAVDFWVRENDYD